jgi:transmembrane sensor
MKEMKNNKLTDKEWEELASVFSGENDTNMPLLTDDKDILESGIKWKELGKMENDEEIDVNKAWNSVSARIKETDGELQQTIPVSRMLRTGFFRIAAAALLVLAIGSIAILVNRPESLTGDKTYTAGADERNVQVKLPDGSSIFLNRNSELRYNDDFGKQGRNVELRGEAFFDITADASKPFRIDAGKAVVEVVGTSFSVLTENSGSDVEVFVKTGKVVVADTTGNQSLVLEPGYIGTINSEKSAKTINNDPNYLAWNTGNLLYKGEKLEVVIRDLKKVYNMQIVAEDPSILEYPWNSSIDYQPQDNIIRMICLSFNLSYSKDGDVYRLSKK